MAIAIAGDVFGGISTGYVYGESKKKEDEIKQGKNYLMSSFAQTGQLVSIANVADKYISLIPAGAFRTTAKVFSNILPLLALPVLMVAGAVKQGLYEIYASRWNKWQAPTWLQKIKLQLPESLSSRTRAVYSFMAEHAGDIFRVMFATSLVALAILGHYAFAAGGAVALIYTVLDSRGLIPRKISLFMERYMPVVAAVGILFTGIVVAQIAAIAQIVATIFSRFNHFFQAKLDLLLRKITSISGYCIEELEAPLVQKELSYAEIKAIMHASPSDFIVNPAHYTKGLSDNSLSLREDHEFETLERLFNQIEWPLTVLKKRLKDDDRFIDFMTQKLPDVTKTELKSSFEVYLGIIAARENISADQYAHQWIQKQMHTLVQVLQGKAPLQGQQVDLDDAIHMCAKIIPLLEAKAALRQDVLTLQDGLIKLAVEGGNYCARGVKRACDELLETLVSTQEETDPVKNYEHKVYAGLIGVRKRIIQKAYEIILKPVLPESIAHDTHTFDIYRLMLTFGFSPLTQFEREEVGLSNLIGWWSMAFLRNLMMEEYEKRLLSFEEDVFKSIGEVYLGPYLASLIENNTQLTPQQKEELRETYIDLSRDESSSLSHIEQSWRLLALTQLGILKLKGS